MANPAAKQGDQIVATDIHIVMIPTPGGPVPTPLPHPFVGQLDGSLSSDVKIEGKPAATKGSTATNMNRGAVVEGHGAADRVLPAATPGGQEGGEGDGGQPPPSERGRHGFTWGGSIVRDDLAVAAG